MIRVVIVDDEALVRSGFTLILNATPDIRVVASASGVDALEVIKAEKPDVLLLDIRMPQVDGLTLLNVLTAMPDRPAIAMLTTFDADEYVHEALRAGASGFLLKDALPEELVQAVRVVASGDALLAPRITRRLLERFAENRPRTGGAELRLKGLTEREHEILVLIGRGLSNREIASSLFLAEQTVKTHVSRVFAKLGLRDRVQAVILAYDAGLVAPAG